MSEGLERESEQESRGGEPEASSSGIGDRVAGILRAADGAAEEILAEARADAARLRSSAADAAETRVQELVRESEQARQEADDYARDIRLAVEAYASSHRRQAEQEARELVREAERRAESIRGAAEELARQIEQAAVERQEKLRNETRGLEERRRKTLRGLRKLASGLRDLLEEQEQGAASEGDLLETLESQRRRRIRRPRDASDRR